MLICGERVALTDSEVTQLATLCELGESVIRKLVTRGALIDFLVDYMENANNTAVELLIVRKVIFPELLQKLGYENIPAWWFEMEARTRNDKNNH